MPHEYARRRRAEHAQQNIADAPQPSFDALRVGAAMPTRAQLGRRVDLPDAMRAKMEESFGADLSAVKLYESEAVADAGANAITQGSNIAFAPGMLDFTSFGGQSLLGHEISHVVSQARGEVTGGGFLNDHALEARADREGAMAAAGQQIAMPEAPLSGVTAAAAAGPMQANKEERYRQHEIKAYDQYIRNGKQESSWKEYEKYRNKKEARMRKAGADDDQIREDSFRTTGGIYQLERSQRKHLKEGATADDHREYMLDLRRILNGMSDEDLRAQPEFQRGMVNAYSDAYKAGLGQDVPSAYTPIAHGAFMPSYALAGTDPLGSMYARLMGTENIAKTMNGEDYEGILPRESGLDDDGSINQNVAIGRMGRLVKSSGVSELLKQQVQGTLGIKPDDSSTSAAYQEMDTMRGFWNSVVMPHSRRKDVALAMQNTMKEKAPNALAEEHRRGHLVPSTGDKLKSEFAADYLSLITPRPKKDSEIEIPGEPMLISSMLSKETPQEQPVVQPEQPVASEPAKPQAPPPAPPTKEPEPPKKKRSKSKQVPQETPVNRPPTPEEIQARKEKEALDYLMAGGNPMKLKPEVSHMLKVYNDMMNAKDAEQAQKREQEQQASAEELAPPIPEPPIAEPPIQELPIQEPTPHKHKSKKHHGPGILNAPLSSRVQTYHDDSALSISEQVEAMMEEDAPQPKKKKKHSHHHHH